jgi:hypothetical protein
MNETAALLLVILLSTALSTATTVAIHAPLRRLLEAICPLGHTAVFWTRASLVVIYLLPLWVVLAFGLPRLDYIGNVSVGEVARRGLVATSFALVLIVVVLGLRLSAARPPEPWRSDHVPPAQH